MLENVNIYQYYYIFVLFVLQLLKPSDYPPTLPGGSAPLLWGGGGTAPCTPPLATALL